MKFKTAAISPFDIVPGFHARTVHSEQVSMAFVNVDSGAVLPEHSHPHEQLTTVLEGLFEITIDGQVFTLAADEGVVIPSNAPHSGRALEPCRIVDVFSPVREDFKERQGFLIA